MLKHSFARCFVAALTLVFASATLGAAAAPADDAKAAVQRFVDGMHGGPNVSWMCEPTATVVMDVRPYVISGPGACSFLIGTLYDIYTRTARAPTVVEVYDKTAYVVCPARFVRTVKGAQVTKTGVLTFVVDQTVNNGWMFSHVTWARTR